MVSWFASARRDVLRQCPSEATFYSGLGLAVLLTAVLSGSTMAIAPGFVLLRPATRLWPVAPVWRCWDVNEELLDQPHAMVLKLRQPKGAPRSDRCRRDLGRQLRRGRHQPIRVAVGRWRPRSIYCVTCGAWFRDSEESLTNGGQAEVTRRIEVATSTVPGELPVEREVRLW